MCNICLCISVLFSFLTLAPLLLTLHFKARYSHTSLKLGWFIECGFCRYGRDSMLWWNLVVIVVWAVRCILQRDCHAILFYGRISPPSAMICHLLVKGEESSQLLLVGGLWQICRALRDNSWSCLSTLHQSLRWGCERNAFGFYFQWYLSWQRISFIILDQFHFRAFAKREISL